MEILQIALHISYFLWDFPNLALLVIVSQKHHNPYVGRFCRCELSLGTNVLAGAAKLKSVAGEGFCWHKMMSVGCGPRLLGRRGWNGGTTQHPQECRIKTEHLTFCCGSNQVCSHSLHAGCIAIMTYLGCCGEGNSAIPAGDCEGIHTLLI